MEMTRQGYVKGIGELQDEVAIWRAKYESAMRGLESLTPGGSEYVNDPERCTSYLRGMRAQQWESLKLAIKERNQQQRFGALVEQIRSITIAKGETDATAMEIRELIDGWLGKEEKP